MPAQMLLIKGKALYPELAACLPDAPIWDMAEQIDTMAAVGEAVEGAQLPHLKPYFRGYQMGTELIAEQLESGGFEFPDRIPTIVGTFAELTYRALRFHAWDASDKVCPAWQAVFYARGAVFSHPAVAMAAGSEAHITRDMPETLWLTGAQRQHKGDYTNVIGNVITTTTDLLRPEFFGDSLPGSLLGRIGTAWAKPYILGRREVAWRNGSQLVAETTPPADKRDLTAWLNMRPPALKFCMLRTISEITP